MPDTFVAIVAMALGLLLLMSALGRANWFSRSPLAVRLQAWGGPLVARLVIGAIAAFMLFIGVSLLRR